MSHKCKLIGCPNHVMPNEDYCEYCQQAEIFESTSHEQTQSEMYSVPVGELTAIDVYAVHNMFAIQDCSGALHHASKKILLSGKQGKPSFADITSARDSLNRWLQLNQETNTNERKTPSPWPWETNGS